MDEQPKLLRMPAVCRTVDDLVGLAGQVKMDNAILIGVVNETQRIIFLTTGMPNHEANFILDKVKQLLLGPPPEFTQQ